MRNKILILAADFDNLANTISQYATAEAVSAKQTKAYAAQVGGQRVIIADAGSTKAAIASNFANIVSENPIECVICVGNTAALCDSIRPCTVAICEEALQYDVNFCPLGCAPSVLPGLGKGLFCASKQLVCAAEQAAREEGVCCETGRCISGDQFVACDEQACSLRNQFNGDFLDTETGVIGELAYMYNIPFVSVKGVCNYADCNAVCDYRRCRQQANCKALKVVMEMVCELLD